MGIVQIDDQDWEITHNGREVIHLFDAEGSETFDPTSCVEVNLGAEFVYVKPGDTLEFTRI